MILVDATKSVLMTDTRIPRLHWLELYQWRAGETFRVVAHSVGSWPVHTDNPAPAKRSKRHDAYHAPDLDSGPVYWARDGHPRSGVFIGVVA